MVINITNSVNDLALLRAIFVGYLNTNPNECKWFDSPDICIKYGDYTQMCPYKVDDQPNQRCYCKPA